MNRIMGLILALTVGTLAGCASAGSAGGAGNDAAPSKAAAGSRAQRPSENRMTREASRNLGLAMLRAEPAEQQELYQKALGSALEAIEANPQNPLAWMLAGQAQAKMKDYAKADSSFTRAVELYPDYELEVDAEREAAWVDAYNDAIAAYQEGDLAGAIREMENANSIYRKRPEALHILGTFYANMDESEKAVTAFQGALEVLRNPAYAAEDEEIMQQWLESEEEIVTNLGIILNSLGRQAEAEGVFRAYLERNPGHLGTEVNLAVVLTQQEKVDEANEVLRRLAARDDLASNHLLMVGIGMFNSDNFEEAADAFRRAVEKNPYSRDAQLNLAQSLLRLSMELEEEYNEGENTAVEGRLAESYREMIAASRKTLELDPFNRDVLTFIMRGQQGLSQLKGEASNQNQHQSDLQATLEAYENLPFEISDLSMQSGSTELSVSASLVNLKLQEGETVTIRFTALSSTGAILGAEDVTVTAGAVESRTPLWVSIPVTSEMEGWKYERVQ